MVTLGLVSCSLLAWRIVSLWPYWNILWSDGFITNTLRFTLFGHCRIALEIVCVLVRDICSRCLWVFRIWNWLGVLLCFEWDKGVLPILSVSCLDWCLPAWVLGWERVISLLSLLYLLKEGGSSWVIILSLHSNLLSSRVGCTVGGPISMAIIIEIWILHDSLLSFCDPTCPSQLLTGRVNSLLDTLSIWWSIHPSLGRVEWSRCCLRHLHLVVDPTFILGLTNILTTIGLGRIYIDGGLPLQSCTIFPYLSSLISCILHTSIWTYLSSVFLGDQLWFPLSSSEILILKRWSWTRFLWFLWVIIRNSDRTSPRMFYLRPHLSWVNLPLRWHFHLLLLLRELYIIPTSTAHRCNLTILDDNIVEQIIERGLCHGILDLLLLG